MTVITKLLILFVVLNTVDAATSLIGLQLGKAQELNPMSLTVLNVIMKLVVLPAILIYFVQKNIKHPELVTPITICLYVLVLIFCFVVFNNVVVLLREIYAS